ncbi:MAG: hypothetical protein U9O56_09460 [Campylobacterota bacterium]|nr:hypothetical protein [Campylobacterota bacterium]
MLKLLFLLFFSISVLFGSSQSYKVSYDPDYAPYSYTVDEKPYGLFIDIFKE